MRSLVVCVCVCVFVVVCMFSVVYVRMFTVVDVFTVVYVHVYRLFNKSCLKTSWELAWFYSVWWPRCDQGESTEVWPRGKDWSATWGREQRCDQGERTVGARRLWSGAVICGLRQQIALVPACLVLKHASLDQLLPSSQHPSVGQHAASFIISTLGSHRGLGLSLWVCMREREREREWMNEWTLFYEGCQEDSRSFYIQPSPMRETTMNKGYNEL